MASIKYDNNGRALFNRFTKAADLESFITEFSRKRNMSTTLKDTVSYTTKKIKQGVKVPPVDLVNLMVDIEKEFPTLCHLTTPVKENSRKKRPETLKKPTKAIKAIKEYPGKDEDENAAQEEIEVLETKEENGNEYENTFPDMINHSELGKLMACKGEYASYKELLKAHEAGKNLYFVVHFPQKVIRSFNYSRQFLLNEQPDNFMWDFDIFAPVVFGEKQPRVYAFSVYTEAQLIFEPCDFPYMVYDDGKKGRVNIDLKFEIYEGENNND